MWFTGTWGFQWYAARAGAEALAAVPRLEMDRVRWGDVLVGSRTRDQRLVDALSLEHVESFYDGQEMKGHVMGAGAGFYSPDWGNLPWTFQPAPAEWFDAWKIRGRR